MKRIIVDNLRRLMAYHQQGSPTAAARAIGVSQQQFDRILKGQTIKVDTLEVIAKGYHLEPYQLLIPDLDAANPQILRALSAAELRLYKALEEARADALRR